MKYNMKLNNEPFNLIKNGTKTVELRLNDEKRKKIKQDDLIEFTNIKSKEKLLVKVVNLYHYENFEELYKNHNKISIGYLKEDVPNPSDMSIYYNQSDIKKYGTLAIEIRLAKGDEFFENSNL